MTDLIILAGMAIGFVLVAWVVDRLGMKHHWIGKK